MGDATLGAVIELKDLFTDELKKFHTMVEKSTESAEASFGELNSKVDRFGDELEEVTTKSRSFFGGMLSGFSKLGNVVTAMSAGVLVIGKVFKTAFGAVRSLITDAINLFIRLAHTVTHFATRAVRELLDVAEGLDRIAKTAVRVGVSAEDLTALSLAVDLTGTSVEALAVGLRTASRNLDDYRRGTGEAKDAFEALGITQEEAINDIRSGADLLKVVTERYHLLGDEAQRTAIMQRVFGRSGTELKPIAEGGAEALDKMIAKMEEMGGVFTGAELKRVEDMNDAITELTTAWQAIKRRVLIDVAPAIKEGITYLQDFFRENRDAITGLLDGVLGKAATTFAKFAVTWKEVSTFAINNWDETLAVLKELTKQSVLAVGTVLIQGFTTAFKVIGNVLSRIWESIMVDRFGDIATKGVNVLISLFGWLTRQMNVAVRAIEAVFEFVFTNIGAAFSLFVVNPIITALNWLVKQFKIAWAIIRASFDFVAQNIRAAFNRVVDFVAGALQDLIGVVKSVESVIGDIGLGGIEQEIAEFRSGLNKAGQTASEFGDNITKNIRELDLGPAIGKIKAVGMTADEMMKNFDRKVRETEPILREFFDSIQLPEADIPIGKLLHSSIVQGLLDSKGDIDAFLGVLSTSFGGAIEKGLGAGGEKIEELRERLKIIFAEIDAAGSKGVDGDRPKKSGGNTESVNVFTESLQYAHAAVMETKTALVDHLFAAAENGFRNMSEAAKAFGQDLLRIFGRKFLELGIGALFKGVGLDTLFGGTAKKETGGVVHGRMGSPVPYRQMASGGIADEPMLVEFGEGDEAEAFVPLPDNRSIPVTINLRRTGRGGGGGGESGGATTVIKDQRKVEILYQPQFTSPDVDGIRREARAHEERIRAIIQEEMAYNRGVKRLNRRNVGVAY